MSSPTASMGHVLRIASRCATPEQFVAVFRRFCDEQSIFIVTKAPKKPGPVRFCITLRDGKPMILGAGKVVEAHTESNNAFGRPGMRIEFTDLDAESRKTIAKLNVGAKAVQPPRGVQPRSSLPRVQHDGVSEETLTAPEALKPPVSPIPRAVAHGSHHDKTRPDTQRPNVKPPSQPNEYRTSGSALVLPANPLGDVEDESLLGFIECSLFEGDGNTPRRALTPPVGIQPIGTARNDVARAAIPFLEVDAPSPWTEQAPAGTPPPSPLPGSDGGARPPIPHAGPVPDGSFAAAPQDDTASISVADLLPHRHVSTRTIAVICGMTACVSLALGYALWGGGEASSASDDVATATEPAAPSQVGAPAAEAEAPVAAAEPADEPAADEPAADEPAADEPAAAPDSAGGSLEPTAREPALAVNTANAMDPCSLHIDSRPSGATVFVGARSLGATPLDTELPCGETALVIKRTRYTPLSETVELNPGVNELGLQLARPTHRLLVNSSPPGATVTVNGRRVGTTPTSVAVLGFETARIRVTKANHKPISKKVYVRRARTSVKVQLQRTRRAKSRAVTKRKSRARAKR